MNRKAIYIAAAATLVEVCLFVSLGLLTTSSLSGIFITILRVLYEDLGAIVVAVITTWYVVFTYYLLQIAEATRRIQAEPFLSLRWVYGSEAGARQAEHFDQLSQHYSSLFGFEKTGTAPSARPRYVCLQFSNDRAKTVGELQVEIEIQEDVHAPMRTDVAPVVVTINEQHCGLSTAPVQYVVVDLEGIPAQYHFIARVIKCTYTAIDEPTTFLSNIGGEKDFRFRGIEKLRVEAAEQMEDQKGA